MAASGWTAARAVLRGPSWPVALVIGLVVIAVPYLGLSYSVFQQIELSLILALVVSGLNLSLGYAGELALGQAAMYAGGAYAAGLLSVHGHSDILVQLIVGALAALLIGVITGVPGLRLGRWSLAMTSFFLVLLVPDVLTVFNDQTGGPNGLSGIAPPTLVGSVLTTNGLYVTIAIITVLWFAVMRNIAVSRHGIAFRVLKQSPVLASSLGISVFRMKLLAYALGALPAGLAGVLFANLELYISPDAFSFTFATTVLAASVLGGAASVYGAAVGAFVLQFGLNESGDFQRYSLVVTGAFLLVGGVVFTGGLAGLARGGWHRLVQRWAVTAPDPGARPDADGAAGGIEAISGARLSVSAVSKAFGGLAALDGVSLVAEPGRVTALIGPNGSGKTTLLNMVCGFYRADHGTIGLGERALQGRRPDQVARAGVARTFQTPSIPEGITVTEAVIAGRYSHDRVTVAEAVLRLPRYRRVRRRDLSDARRVLDLVGIGQLADAEATSLPLGQRRLLEVARCLIGDPGVLLLDEVASGLDEGEVGRLVEVIRRVRDAGATVVLVEHNFALVLAVADDIYVLAQGKQLAHGSPAEIESDPRVMGEYLGVAPGDGEQASYTIRDLVTEGERRD